MFALLIKHVRLAQFVEHLLVFVMLKKLAMEDQLVLLMLNEVLVLYVEHLLVFAMLQRRAMESATIVQPIHSLQLV